MSVLDLVSRLAWKRQIQSSLPIPPYSGLEIGGGIGREAVLGGAVLGGIIVVH